MQDKSKTSSVTQSVSGGSNRCEMLVEYLELFGKTIAVTNVVALTVDADGMPL
jgi:hypothetical protein